MPPREVRSWRWLKRARSPSHRSSIFPRASMVAGFRRSTRADLRLPAVLVRADLHRALSVDVAGRAAAHRLDPRGAPQAGRRRSRRGAAPQGGVRRRHRGPREGAGGGPRPRADARQRDARKGGGSRRGPPQGGGCEAPCPHRRSGEGHCRDPLGGHDERARHRERGRGGDRRAADRHRAGEAKRSPRPSATCSSAEEADVRSRILGRRRLRHLRRRARLFRGAQAAS